MEENTENLIQIESEKIEASSKNIFFGLGLIRNDFGDLAYLQGLHAKEYEKLDLTQKFSSENGQYSGRNIYLFRLALSHLYSVLEFLEERKDDIFKNEDFKSKLKKLSKEDRDIWNSFMDLSSYTEKGKKIEDAVHLSKTTRAIFKLSCITRHELTYHYHGSLKYLSRGYKIAFQDKKDENTEFACVSEILDVKKHRSYYIDISIQKYLEDQIGLRENLFPKFENKVIELISDFYAVSSKLLKIYHEELAKK
jgi:hypothetical protein